MTWYCTKCNIQYSVLIAECDCGKKNPLNPKNKKRLKSTDPLQHVRDQWIKDNLSSNPTPLECKAIIHDIVPGLLLPKDKDIIEAAQRGEVVKDDIMTESINTKIDDTVQANTESEDEDLPPWN